MMCKIFDQMKPEKKENHIKNAKKFLSSLNK